MTSARSDFSDKTGRSDLERDHILEERRNLEQQRQQLEMELIGLNARRGAMLEQIAILQEKYTLDQLANHRTDEWLDLANRYYS